MTTNYFNGIYVHCYNTDDYILGKKSHRTTFNAIFVIFEGNFNVGKMYIITNL